jgi:hypothetical protein
LAYAGFALLLMIRHYAIHLHLYAMGVKGCGRKRQTTGWSEVEGVRPSSLGSDGDMVVVAGLPMQVGGR